MYHTVLLILVYFYWRGTYTQSYSCTLYLTLMYVKVLSSMIYHNDAIIRFPPNPITYLLPCHPSTGKGIRILVYLQAMIHHT